MNCAVPNWATSKQPFDVYAIDDFSAPQIARAAEEPGKYSAALVFSTKYDPPRPLLEPRAPAARRSTSAIFGLHHDLPPEAIARQLRRHGGIAKSSETRDSGSD